MTRQVFIMAFSSLSFLFLFLPFFLILYYCSPFFLKNMVLLAGSLCFYAWGTWGNPFHFFLLPASVLVSFTVGNLMEHSRTARKRRAHFLSPPAPPHRYQFLYVSEYIIPCGCIPQKNPRRNFPSALRNLPVYVSSAYFRTSCPIFCFMP